MSRTGWTVLVVAVVIVVVAAGFEVATRSARPPSPAAGPEEPAAGQQATLLPSSIPPATASEGPDRVARGTTAGGEQHEVADGDEVDALRTLTVDLFFVRPDGQGLSPVSTEIFATAALLDRLKQTVSALTRGPGPDSPLDPVLPVGTSLRDLYLDKGGILYVDFGQELISTWPSGSAAEVLAAGALANTLIVNFAEVRKVRILVAGEEIRTLGGHLDLTLPLTAEPGLVMPWIEREE